MRRVALAVVLIVIGANIAVAHLCNDVFEQARDNLAVKVDIRDGQLRIREEASFRVYLLNTMDRVIVNINLAVRSEAFDATVKPSPSWKGFPSLKAVREGGKKEYFEVTLRRKAGVPDGAYKIQLHLFNARNPRQVFKTIDVAEATDTTKLPKGRAAVDGDFAKEEWEHAPVFTGFTAYQKVGRYFENRPCAASPRIRMLADDEFVYCLIGFATGGQADEISMYVARDGDSKPVKVVFNGKTGAAACGPTALKAEFDKAKATMEVAIPRAALGVADAKAFFVNFTQQEGGKPAAYWRGNQYSYENPVVFSQFVLD